ncbi:MAG: rRNA pseudouridine synthase [Clostridia bacterium]|nr:rRNA pseudouridine synthase [Clostridia bacterium]
MVIFLRLDRFLSNMGKATRSESSRLVRMGKVIVNGVPAKKSDMQINPDTDEVVLNGAPVTYKQFTYIMLNKPEGYVSATDDPQEKTVLDLVDPEDRRKGLFPCGRLDKNTLGLVILTNDGEGAHRCLSPKHHVSKVYRFETLLPISQADKAALEKGVDIGGYTTRPCSVALTGERTGKITLTEGKYHQIKRMLEAVNNKITYLERISFGTVELDPSLERGEWRYLTKEEEKIFLKGE